MSAQSDVESLEAGGAPAASTATRRQVLRGAAAGAAVLAAGGLAACGSGSGTAAGPATGGAATGGSPTPAGEPEQTPDGAASPDTGSGGTPVVAAADVPVGGGTIVDQRIVVTQPVQGEFRGFGAICTHQRCPLGNVDGGTINCTCHGSRFSIEDGSVANGPATQSLPQVPVRLDGDQVVEG